MNARKINQPTLALNFLASTIVAAVFGIANVAEADTVGLQVAAGESSGSYGGTSDTANQPGQPTERSGTENSNGSAADDSLITAKVKSALISDDQVKPFDISVRTRQGEVVLTGMVDNQDQIDRAVQLASDVDGVTSVSNRLTIKK